MTNWGREDFERVKAVRCVADGPALLTKGRVYDLLDDGPTWVDVRNDSGAFDSYPMEYFEPVPLATG